MKAWLVSLPPSEVHDSARAIFDALTSLNRTRMDADDRLKLLELYQVSIDMLEAPLESVFTSVAQPARERARAAGLLARNLQLEMANGYKLVLREKLSARFTLSNRNIPLLIQKLLAVHAKLMWICSKNYLSVPDGVWLEVHQICHYAIQQRMLDGPEQVERPILTIGGYYKQILLLALADPYRYQPHELDKIRELILHYGSLANISLAGESRAEGLGGMFAVKLDRDQPPQFYDPGLLDEFDTPAILLDSSDMAQMLRRVESAAELKIQSIADKTRAFASLDLLRRVIRQWSIAPKRVFQRISPDARVSTCTGLRSVTQLLGSQTHATGAEPVRSILPPPSLMHECKVLNESPCGFALRLSPVPQHCTCRVGDVVVVRAVDTRWMPGVLRWMQTVDQGAALEIGVQIIAPTADVVDIRPATSNGEGAFQTALSLPEVSVLDQPALLVAPRGTFSPGRELFIHGETARYVKVTRLVDQTPGMELIAYSELG
ncbi:hypothetical protein KSF73_02020 [Burkholderiaceae bacterium DAT-1]|nr:hypothetical protein [Burkholderiaceae bacterium DAT-1]